MDITALFLLVLGLAVGLAAGVALGWVAASRNREELARQVGALSQQALDRSTDRLTAMTDERLRHAEALNHAELEQRRQAVAALVHPLQESLARVQEQVAQVEVERARAYSGLMAEVVHMRSASDQLRDETKQLVTALRNPQARGRWGELQLRRTVEASGMVEHVDFSEQVTVGSDTGVQRPDLVVHLAGDKHVVVDSKVAFSAFLEAQEARDEQTRNERLKAHARHLRDHVDSLAAKTYWEQFDSTPEFVVLFVPAETFLNAALEQDPTLLERGFEKNVVIATPATLVALLRTVGYTWRQDALARNAQEVFALGKELHGRLATLGGHVSKLGTTLNRAVEAYNETVGSLESRVLVSARKLADLHGSDKPLDTPDQIDTLARQVQRPELVASAEDALVALPDAADSTRDTSAARAAR